MNDTPDVARATKQLVTALDSGRFEYALIGGMAVILSGYDRFTRDVDAVVWDLDDRLEELVSLLEAHGFSFRVPDGLSSSRVLRVLRLQNDENVDIDLSMGLLPFEREVITRSHAMRLSDGVSGHVATVEDLLIMKLVASRNRDLDDVTRLLELYPDQNKKRIRKIVTEYAEALENPEILHNLNDRLG